MIKYVLQILLAFIPVLVIGQHHSSWDKMVLGITKKFPMRNGEVFYMQRANSLCGMAGVTIFSNNDSVFSGCKGKVQVVFDLGDAHALVFKDDENTFHTITQLTNVVVKKNDNVTKGMFLGKAKEETDLKNIYSVLYMITDSYTKYFSEKKVWQCFQIINNDECTEEFIYQPNL